MVCRKSTYCFVDFLLGKYSDKNAEYLKFMIKNMTYYERMAITTKTYEELWSDLYSNSRTPTGRSMNMYLKNSINHEIYLLFLIQHCHVNIDIQNGDFLKVDQTNQKTLSIVRVENYMKKHDLIAPLMKLFVIFCHLKKDMLELTE